MKSKVYFSREITPEKVVELYHKLGLDLPGKVAVKAPMHNPLHYVLTYWKGDTLYTLDPGRGKEEARQNFIDGTTTKWCFCNSGIFIQK